MGYFGEGSYPFYIYEQEYEYLTLARVLIAQDKAEQAIPLLDRLIASAEGAGRKGRLIAYLSLQAVAHHTQHKTEQGLPHLSRALALGEPEGYVRTTFVDLGPPMRELLQVVARQGVAPDYVSRLLAAFPKSLSLAESRDSGQAQLRTGPLRPVFTVLEMYDIMLIHL